VDPITRVILRDAGPITCNRKPAKEYTFLFREGMAGSEHLTKAMVKRFGAGLIETTSDILKGPQHDMREKWVYEREKKRAKSRECLIDHWSPNCRTASHANRKPLRWKDEPYGHEQNPKLLDDSLIMVRVGKLAMIKHMVGDFFGIEHIYPTPMLEMDTYKELLAMPGVFVLTWDNCEYDEEYVHRQCYITNMWWLAALSRDCQNKVTLSRGGTPHVHVMIAPQSGPGIKAGDVAPFATKWCAAYADLTYDWVKAPLKERCVHCASLTVGSSETAASGNDAALQQRLDSVLPVAVLPVWSSDDWQGGRWNDETPTSKNNENSIQGIAESDARRVFEPFKAQYDGAGFVLSMKVVPKKVYRRVDKGASCFRTTHDGGPNWNQVTRRVTIDRFTKEVLADEDVVAVGRAHDWHQTISPPRDLITLLHYIPSSFVESVSAGGKKRPHFRDPRPCGEDETARLKALLDAREGYSPKQLAGEWMSGRGEILKLSRSAAYTVGISKELKEKHDIWGRSVYGGSFDKVKKVIVWTCYECDALCTTDMITKVGLGQQVDLLLEIYSPKEPEMTAVLEGELEDSLALEPSTKEVEPSWDELEDLETDNEAVARATGAATVSKSAGFGKTRAKPPEAFSDDQMYCPVYIPKVAQKLGVRTLNEEVHEGQIMHVSGTVCSVQEAVFQLQKPTEIQGQESSYQQTVYLKSPEGFWFNWRYRVSLSSLGEAAWGSLPYGFSQSVVHLYEPTALVEKANKAGHYSYKSEGKKVAQENMFPELRKEIEEKRKALHSGVIWPDKAARNGSSYRAALWKACVKDDKWKIGGDAHTREDFFERVIAKHQSCFWMEGCAAPTVRDHVVEFGVKPGAKPVSRQPIPLSPYDEVRVEYHIEENCTQGKMRKINTLKEGLPEWSTPVFIVDQDAKGLLGRMVCVYGPVNKELEIASFPSADPQKAFECAAGKKHHTLVDAIWGYTQFLIGPRTRRLLVVCSRSGLYEWLRMPFGPSPAPAHMQSYVAKKFGELRSRVTGEAFCTPLMDDIVISSEEYETHIDDVNLVCETAEANGFEFKFAKGQFNFEELELWGCICGGFGKRAMPKKIEQLEQWPIPKSGQALNSFLCFVNYLRDYMDPEWTKYEATLAPFRKKDCDFSKFGSDGKYVGAFKSIRTMLSRKAVLMHPDYIAASVPWESGRPFEIFVDASDYGWCAVLCQRPKPHAAPMIIGMISKAFSDTQLRWSAMERELYGLWQGVVGFERLIRGFKVYVYMDHKNNLYSEALLDNRRVAKKMLNWALELQHFNIVKVWIRGEANILADAPSRAPWESELMEHLPLADLPLRELINKMYREPATFETLVQEVKAKRGGAKRGRPWRLALLAPRRWS